MQLDAQVFSLLQFFCKIVKNRKLGNKYSPVAPDQPPLKGGCYLCMGWPLTCWPGVMVRRSTCFIPVGPVLGVPPGALWPVRTPTGEAMTFVRANIFLKLPVGPKWGANFCLPGPKWDRNGDRHFVCRDRNGDRNFGPKWGRHFYRVLSIL